VEWNQVTLAAVWLTWLAVQAGPAPRAQPLERATKESDGAIRIVFHDGTSVRVAPEAAEDGSQETAVYSEPRIADDRRTVGWMVEYPNCCTSYPVPLVLVVYRDGKPLLRLRDGLMMYDWYFLGGGGEVVFHADTVHFNRAPHAVRVETATGRILERFDGTVDERSPAWTRRPR
jgi:hypothetical protein